MTSDGKGSSSDAAVEREKRLALRRYYIPRRLREARLWRKFSQEELAEACGIGQNRISNYETSKKLPQLDTVHILAAELHVNPRWLIGEVSEWTPTVK